MPKYAHIFSSLQRIADLALYYSYSHRDGPLADADIQCFSKCTHSIGKIRKVLSQQFASYVDN